MIGLDGGSTSSKCVFIDENENILKKVYTLSKGNPIQDMKDMFTEMRQWATDQGATLEVTGFGVTGYAGDVLERSLGADANIVETVAHMMSAKRWFPSVDVICDIGGQDIKVMFMQNGDVKNFRLSNSCSAGNGMLLQAMADQFGIPVKQYAEVAFEARLAPKFSYGCAVFLDSDRVNFQKEGYAKEELLAGLALVLPKNIWQYVVQIPRMAELGRVFVLQGGTQKNIAALKAQVDYIEKRVPNAEVYLHPHCGEAGAIGAAFEALRVTRRRGTTTFVGLDQAIDIDYVVDQRREHALQLLPEQLLAHVHRHQDARRQDRPLHLRLLLREGHRREHGRAEEAQQGAPEAHEEVPEPRRLRGQARVQELLRAGADAGARRAGRRRRRQAHAARRGPPQGDQAPVPARERRGRGRSARTSASASRAC